jgi:hypothetical protein
MFDLFMPFIGSMLRHALTLCAGYLVAAGLLPAAQANGFVGACLLFAGIGWSLWNKLNRPEVLAKLQQRQMTQNVQAKQAQAMAFDKVFNAAGAAMITFAVIVGLAVAPSPASAQVPWFWSSPVAKPKPRVKKTGTRPQLITVEPMKVGLSSLLPQVSVTLPSQSPADALWASISKVALDDLQFAKALADGINPQTNASQARSACYGALVTLIVQQSSAAAALQGGLGAPAAPVPAAPHTAAITKFEQLAQLSDALQSGSPIQVACAPVAQAMRLQFAQFLTQIAAGGLSLGKLGILP